MNHNVKRVLAILVILITFFAWYVSIFGIGSVDSAKDALKYGLDIKDCFVIGDMGKNEIVMAYNAGCKGVLVLTGGGKGSLGEFRDTWAGYEAHIIADNALEAVKYILKEIQ